MEDKIYKIQKTTLTDVADAIREKTNETELIPTTEFAEKILSIQTGVAEDVIETAQTEISEISEMQFSKTENGEYTTVTLPHTCNDVDAARKSSMYRGLAYYKYTLSLTEEDIKNGYTIQFEQVGQISYIYCNNVLLHENRYAYTPFSVRLTNLVVGDNEIKIVTRNDYSFTKPLIVPQTADFSMVNGIYGKAYLIKSKGLYFTPEVQGIDKCHITPTNFIFDDNSCDCKIETAVRNLDGEINAKSKIKIEIIDPDSQNAIYTSEDDFSVDANEVAIYSKDFKLVNLHLWDSKADPFRYIVKITLKYNGKTLDTISLKYGFRDLKVSENDKDCRILLNGKHIDLFGVSLHQDSDNRSAAKTDEDYKSDLEIIKELGTPMIRLAHYSHNVREIELFDENGITMQTEVPWVNNFGKDAPKTFTDNIYEQCFEMVNNLYNHCGIAFWGISNELGGNHTPNGYTGAWSTTDLMTNNADYDGLTAKQALCKLHNKCYKRIKELDGTRLVGYAANVDTNGSSNLYCDYSGYNDYPYWYNGTSGGVNISRKVSWYVSQKRFTPSITEYGFGANPLYHNDQWSVVGTGVDVGSGKHKHPEEYATYQHMYQMNALLNSEYKPAFTSVWVLFDFGFYGRNEGKYVGYNDDYIVDDTLIGINDKGIVTRDRKIKKDAFYYYKSLWNPTKMVHILERRWTQRTSNKIAINVISNCDKIELYRKEVNGTFALKETLTTPNMTSYVNTSVAIRNGWSFSELQFFNETDEYKVIGYTLNEDGVSYSEATIEDIVSFETLSDDYLNKALILPEVTKVEIAGEGEFSHIDVYSTSEYSIGDHPEWIIISKDDTGINYIISENDTGEVRSANVILSLAENSDVNATISFNQAAYNPNGYIEITSDKEVHLGGDEEYGVINVIAAENNWTFSTSDTNPDWIAFEKISDNELKYYLDKNETESERSIVVTVTDRLATDTVTITQAIYSAPNYTPVEYLESNGVQWINTNIIPNSATITTADLAPNVGQSNSNFVFGCRDSSAGTKRYEVRPTQIDYAVTNFASGVPNISGARHTIDFGNGKYIVDNSTTINLTGSFTGDIPMYIFGGNTSAVPGAAATANNLASMKLYSIKIEEDGQELFNAIPVKDIDGVPALYDKVSEQLFYNQGSSSDFIVGPDLVEIPAKGILYEPNSIACHASALDKQSIKVSLIPSNANLNTDMTFSIEPSTLGTISYNEETKVIEFTPNTSVITENIEGNIIGTLPDGKSSNVIVVVQPVPLVSATDFTLAKDSINTSINSTAEIGVVFDPVISTENTELVLVVEPNTLGTASYADHKITFVTNETGGEGTISVSLPDNSVTKEISVSVEEHTYLAYYDFTTKGAGSTDTTIEDATGNTTATLKSVKSASDTYGLEWQDTGLRAYAKDGVACGGVVISKPEQFNAVDCPNGVKIYMEYKDIGKATGASNATTDLNWRGRVLKLPANNPDGISGFSGYAMDMYVNKNVTRALIWERSAGDVGLLSETFYPSDVDVNSFVMEITIPKLDDVDFIGTINVDGKVADVSNDFVYSVKSSPVYPPAGTIYPSKFYGKIQNITQFELLNRASDYKRGLNGTLVKFYIEKL